MSAALPPVGARVRVIGSPEWVGSRDRDLIGKTGVVAAHVNGITNLYAAIEQFDDGTTNGEDDFWFTADELEVVS